MDKDFGKEIADSLVSDILNGDDPLTPTELKRAFDFCRNLEADKCYSLEDMKLFYRFVSKFYSIGARNTSDYLRVRSISRMDRLKAEQLAQAEPLFVPQAEAILGTGINFMSKTESGHTAPIIKEFAIRMGQVNLADFVIKNRGFDALPQIYSDYDYNDLNSQPIFRGFKTITEIRDFIFGALYVGSWKSGSGIYFTSSKEYAELYEAETGLVLECKLTAHEFISNEIAMEAMTIDTSKGLYDQFYDVGIYGALKGFDVINRVENGVPTQLILNRGKIIISETTKNKFNF